MSSKIFCETVPTHVRHPADAPGDVTAGQWVSASLAYILTYSHIYEGLPKENYVKPEGSLA